MEWFDWLQSLVKVVSTHFTFLLCCLTDQNICKIAPTSQTGERVKQTFQFFTIFIGANLSLIVVVIVSLLFCIKHGYQYCFVCAVLAGKLRGFTVKVTMDSYSYDHWPGCSAGYQTEQFYKSYLCSLSCWRVGRTHFYLVLWRVGARQAKCQLQAHKSRIIIGSFKPFWFILNLRNLPSECTRYEVWAVWL